MASERRHELLELAVGHGPLRIELHRGDGQLAGALVGDTEHRAVDDRGMSVQDGLDLRWRDLEAR